MLKHITASLIMAMTIGTATLISMLFVIHGASMTGGGLAMTLIF